MDFKNKIITELDTLRKKEQQDKQPFKARAYAKVIGEIKAHQGGIYTIDDVKDISGVGDRIRAKIKEIIDSGELLAAKVVREERQFNVLDDLLTIHGIGPVKAKELVSKHAVRSVEDLREKVGKNPSILNDVQKMGLRYHDDISKRIPRAEMMSHEKLLMRTIGEVSNKFHAMVVGSYRRKLNDSGDIDVILKLPNTVSAKESGELFKNVITKLTDDGYIIDILAKGTKKCMAIVRIGNGMARRLDLLLTPEDEYGYALLYFTGSGPFNVVMRQYALEKGYTLNEHRMKTLSDIEPQPPAVPKLLTEQEIFRFLKVPFIQPENRTAEEFQRVLKR